MEIKKEQLEEPEELANVIKQMHLSNISWVEGLKMGIVMFCYCFIYCGIIVFYLLSHYSSFVFFSSVYQLDMASTPTSIVDTIGNFVASWNQLNGDNGYYPGIS